MNTDGRDKPTNSGFLKITRPELPALSGSRKSALIRIGNQYFHAGRLDEAEKIFLTTGYTDGLIRLGDYFYKNHQTLEAYRMYCLAPDKRRKEAMQSIMALVIRGWMRERSIESTK